MRTKTTTKKTDRREQAKVEFAKVVESVSVQGFHGTANVTVHVQDGHIQYSRVVVERTVR